MKKILVLGSTGMLGSAVGKHFEKNENYQTVLTYRNKDVSYGKDKVFFDPLFGNKINKVPINNADYVINCIGVIKPFMNSNPRDSVYLNSVFPHDLAEQCDKKGAKLIHITTDCVFSGLKKTGTYSELDAHDALDAYGKSKSLGEPNNCMVIRTSIIGEEIHKNASLIEWAKSQKGNEVNGFVNHFWNGITTKQYAKVCEKIIGNDLWEKDLFHIHSNIVTKCAMLNYFNDKFNLDLKINGFETPDECNRSLSSVKGLNKKLNIPTVEEQILEL